MGRRVSPCAHLLNIHNCCKKYCIIYSEGVGEVVVLCWGGGGGGGGGERERKATITGKLAIDLNNGVKVINHSQLLELSLIYIYASFAHE